jgi:hypothetical protein
METNAHGCSSETQTEPPTSAESPTPPVV